MIFIQARELIPGLHPLVEFMIAKYLTQPSNLSWCVKVSAFIVVCNEISFKAPNSWLIHISLHDSRAAIVLQLWLNCELLKSMHYTVLYLLSVNTRVLLTHGTVDKCFFSAWWAPQILHSVFVFNFHNPVREANFSPSSQMSKLRNRKQTSFAKDKQLATW